MTLISVADRPGIAAAIFGPLSEAGVNVDMIVQNISEEGRTDMTFSCPVNEVARAAEIKISVLIDRKYMELAVQALHDAFELEKAA